MENKFKSLFMPEMDEMQLSKAPMVAGIIMIYAAAVFLQNINNLSVHSVLLVTLVVALQLLIYLYSGKIFKNKYWLYFVIQGIITFDYVVIIPDGYTAMFLGFIPLFIFQSLMVYYDTVKVVVTSVFFYSIFCITILIYSGTRELIRYIPMLLLITTAIRVYSSIFLRQVALRIQTQKILQELEASYEKVEELTLINERQRMARDLHDTLSQGLAGVIMQLDAINANINNNNIKRAQEIIEKSMEHARKTLSDSRLVIGDLRSQSDKEIDFNKAVENEISKFRTISDITITSEIKIQSKIQIYVVRNIVYIIREALNNIARHSEASHAVVKIEECKNHINIEIRDDGIGFKVKLLDKMIGHYGITGMTERVKTIGGTLKIESQKRLGTSINIAIPIMKGIDDEDE